MLNADQLGKKGEAHFSEICSDAELTCNPSTYDRTGWDFIVEFPYGFPDRQSTLDKRHSPISCHVQVKTMWSSNDEFRMRLSSAERLAKEPKPAFVYVFKVNKKLEFVEANFVHILDDNLAKILKRLRQEHAKGVKAIEEINKKTIAFCAGRAGQLLPPTGKALREALGTLCGPDPNTYMEKKREQLKNLGFDEQRYAAETKFAIGNHDEFVRVFLGLKKVEVTQFKTFETRFGIKLPTSDPDFVKGIMHIQPNRVDQCTITIREDALSPPAVFEGDIFFPPIPKLPRELTKFLVKTKLFQLLIDRQEINFATNDEAMKSTSLKIEDWINVLRMLVALRKGTGSIAIESNVLPGISFPIPSTLDNNGDPAGCIYLLEAFERAQRLLKLAGAAEPMVQFASVASLAGDIIAVSKLFSGVANITFNTECPDGVAIPDKIDTIYANFISIAGVTLVFYAVAEMVLERQADKICWQSRSVDPREIMVLHNFPAGYQEFVDRAKTRTRIDSVVMAQAPSV